MTTVPQNAKPISEETVEALKQMYALLTNVAYQHFLFRKLVTTTVGDHDFATLQHIYEAALNDVIGPNQGYGRAYGDEFPAFSLGMFIDAAPSVTYLNSFFHADARLDQDELENLMVYYYANITPPIVI